MRSPEEITFKRELQKRSLQSELNVTEDIHEVNPIHYIHKNTFLLIIGFNFPEFASLSTIQKIYFQ
jgi:hypothetical protein